MGWLGQTYLHVTPSILKACMPNCPDPDQWAGAFDDALRWHGGEVDLAMLLAQVGHESSDLTRLEEGFNYAASALVPVFGTDQITAAAAQRLGRSPGNRADREAIANDVYGDEWGRRNLGNTEPGDGWRFRGRGPIQITGRANYTALARDTGLAAVEDPDCLLRPAGGALAALWYWKGRLRAGMSIEAATRAINGGTNGLADRRARYEHCQEILG